MGAPLHRGARIELGGPAISLKHKDESSAGSPFPVELGSASSCAPKYGVNIAGGQGKYGFGFSAGSKGRHAGGEYSGSAPDSAAGDQGQSFA